jgi:hypothetical protein
MKLRVLGLLLAVSLAACTDGGSTVSGRGPCPAITGVIDPTATLVSPARGATGVATTIGTISFTVSLAVLRSGTVTLAAPSPETSVMGGPITTDANGVSSVAIPPLQPHTAYHASVASNPVGPGGCPGGATGDLGSFTTQ